MRVGGAGVSIADWVIYYSDGRTFTSDDGAWEDAPGRDVQIVLFRDPELGWTVRHGGKGGSSCDYWRQANDGTIVGMDEDGMKDHVVHQLGVVKQGRMLSQGKWDNLLRQAMKDRNRLREQDGNG